MALIGEANFLIPDHLLDPACWYKCDDNSWREVYIFSHGHETWQIFVKLRQPTLDATGPNGTEALPSPNLLDFSIPGFSSRIRSPH